MGDSSAGSLRNLLVAFILFPCAAGQNIIFMQGIAHPAAAPNLEQHDVARELLFAEQGDISGKLLDEHFVPPDSLVDPNGKVVSATRQRQQRENAVRLAEEAELISSLLRKSSSLTDRRCALPGWQVWTLTMLGCAGVVACGVVPVFVLPVSSGAFLQTTEGRRNLNLLLSFAVGSLLGDVFLHLLPEVWSTYKVNMVSAGSWTACGLMLCFLIEKCCTSTEDSQRRVCAIMNLIANFTDNFTHGLAIGGSFLVGSKFGLLTTFAIIIHEFPHEISDFAILLRADFSISSAVRAQLLTAVGGVVGASAALYLHTEAVMGDAHQWILPFTAGGFINIALAQILPELLRETCPRQSLLQLLLLFTGIAVMAALNQLH